MEIRQLTRKDLSKTAKLYANVFAGPPWNEVSRDPKGNFSSALVGTLCSCCGGILTEAYPQKETEEYIMRETTEKGNKGRAYVAVVGELLAGFGWGYYMNSIRELLDKYKGLGDGEEAESFRTAIINNPQLPGMGVPFIYASEIGVEEGSRNQGIGRELLEIVIGDEKNVVLRTNLDSPMANLARKAGLRQVTLTKENYVEVFDPSNPKRVLFAKKPFVLR